MIHLLLAAVLVGVATWYPAGVYGGGPLYCDSNSPSLHGLTYSRETERWVAISDEMYLTGWQCGDLVRVQFEDRGRSFYARLWDAGPLDHYMADGFPIVVDIPEYFWPYERRRLSAPVTVFNETLANRLMVDAKFGHIERGVK